ncbi:MAG TPA: MlaD family protein [Pseudonocardiaceae bacterium]|jgi:phospholipid/cholesterol/gamma-HCH transport system substrate-binding protein
MITRATRYRVLAFIVIGVLVIGYIGVKYADLGRLVGIRGYYVVKLDLADAGGIFPNAAVTYRGVQVGRVGAVNLTDTGVEADLDIDSSSASIPSNVRAVVADLSAVGEEYVDLRPKSTSGPYLADGSTIQRDSTQLPLPVTNVLSSIDALSASVPQQSLRTVVDELGKAFQGQGQNLQVLLDTSSSLTNGATQDLPDTIGLIDNSTTVLTTQNDEKAALESFSRSLNLLAGQLDVSDSDIRRLITATPPAATQVTDLLSQTNPSLSILLANLLTTSDLTVGRQGGLEELLVALPAAVAAGNTVINQNGANFGMALTFFNPLPCTAGYGGTTYRNGLNTSPSPPLNTNASCTAAPRTGIEVRGSANAPSAGVPAAAQPGVLSTASLSPDPGGIGQLMGLSPR